MNILRELFSSIIAERIALESIHGKTFGSFRHISRSFRKRVSRNKLPHCGKGEAARRLLQHRKKAFHNYSPVVGWNAGAYTNKGGQRSVARCESWRAPHPHAAKFPAGTKQPLPRRRGFYWLNPRFEDNCLILDEIATIPEQAWAAYPIGTVITFEQIKPKRIISGIKWRHL